MKNYLMLVSACACLAACATGSNSNDAAVDEVPAFQKPIDYIPSALGPHSWKITTDSAQAQQYFNHRHPCTRADANGDPYACTHACTGLGRAGRYSAARWRWSGSRLERHGHLRRPGWG